MSRIVPCLIAAVMALSASAARADRDQLVIGITQFPATLSPVIESMLAKSYVLAMTRRPLRDLQRRLGTGLHVVRRVADH